MAEFNHTPFSHLTDDELIRVADASSNDLTRELSSRLESALEELGIYVVSQDELETALAANRGDSD